MSSAELEYRRVMEELWRLHQANRQHDEMRCPACIADIGKTASRRPTWMVRARVAAAAVTGIGLLAGLYLLLTHAA